MRARVIILAVLLTATLAHPVAARGAAVARPPDYLATLKLVNYYPARRPAAEMWKKWSPRTIDADFGRIAGLHANAVRVRVQPAAFGYPTPHPTMLSRLAQVVALAHKHGLRVQLTLFDQWTGYRDVTGSEQWAAAVLRPYAGDKRIVFVELRSEIDAASTTALAWARRLLPYVHRADGGLPITLSTSSMAGLRAFRDFGPAAPLDFYTYDYYSTPALAYALLRQAQQIVAPAALFVGTIGYSPSSAAAYLDGCVASACRDAQQDHYYRTIQQAARTLGLPAVAPWGLYRLDGTPKPVAADVKTFFGTGALDLSFNNSFEMTYGSGKDRLPTEWQIFDRTQARFAIDTTVVHTGHASARISASGGDKAGTPAFYISPIGMAIVPGRAYGASVWMRGSRATGGTRIALAWYDASNTYLGQNESAWLHTGTTTWIHMPVRSVAPARAAYVRILLKSGNNTGTVWFDDVRLVLLR